MNKSTMEMVARLTKAGITLDDALALRRISMTLGKWYELECGDGNDHGSWSIARGSKTGGVFTHDDDGKPYLEHHRYRHGQGKDTVSYTPFPDRETGAKKRLAKIMARYPTLKTYLQTDPRGASLYILRPGDVRDGADPSTCYSNGIAVYR